MKKIILTLILISIFSCKERNTNESSEANSTTQIGNFRLSTSKIKPEINYDLKYEGLAERVEGTIEYITNFEPKKVDLNFKDNQASFIVPKGTEAVYFSLKEDGERDFNDGKGHFLPVYIEDEVSKQFGSLTAMYLLKSPYMGFEKNPKAFLETINEEKKHIKSPSLAFNFHQMMAAKKANDVANLDELQENFIKSYESEALKNEQSLRYYISVLKDKNELEKANEMTQKAYTLFPSGEIRKQYFLKKFENETDPKKEDLILDSINNFIKNDFESLDYALYDKVSLAYRKGDKKRLVQLAQAMRSPIEEAKLYNSLAETEFKKDSLSDDGMNYIEKAYSLIQNRDLILKNKAKYLTINETNNIADYYKDQIISSLAATKARAGSFDEAITLQQLLIDEGKNDEINEKLIGYMMNNKQYEKVIEKASYFYETGHITSKTIKDLENALLQSGKSESESRTLLDNLNKKYVSHKTQIINEGLVHYKAPNFKFKNLEGETVSLSDYKGKIVILDFWATWCGPCKAAFPGMQKALSFYKKEDNVQFLFINTMEFRMSDEAKRKEVISSYIKEKGYTFNVLFDMKAKDNKNEYTAFKDYKLQSLPTKIFIDQNGFVRYIPKQNSVDTDIIFDEVKLIVETIEKNPI
ncbi:TlpA family protein disulfide reductase [Kordia sp.]|uniref:TlpA family protein disulfide reductase n=1 Tax=Kordia sp. TaxID=1965332 RepID=UPI003D2C07D3